MQYKSTCKEARKLLKSECNDIGNLCRPTLPTFVLSFKIYGHNIKQFHANLTIFIVDVNSLTLHHSMFHMSTS